MRRAMVEERPRHGPPALDKAAARRAFDAAAANYDAYAVLQLEVGARLAEGLGRLQAKPRRALDIGTGTGAGVEALMRCYPAARVVGLDISTRMLQLAKQRAAAAVVCGDFERLPIVDGAVDMVFSNMSLQWCDDLGLVFAEARRVLRADGVLLFSTLGPDTLKELRAAWAAADDAPRVHGFIDMHDIGDMLLAAGLQRPVMQREEITMTYGQAADILRDLKHLGATNALKGRRRGLLGKQTYRRMLAAYETRRRPDGRLPVTWEVLYGTAWAADMTRGDGARPQVAVAVDDIGRA